LELKQMSENASQLHMKDRYSLAKELHLQRPNTKNTMSLCLSKLHMALANGHSKRIQKLFPLKE